MSKQADDVSHEDLPPPYSPTSDLSINNPSSSSSSSLFSAHLASIRSQIAAEQAARTSAREQRDSYVLALIVPHVEDLLSSIAGIHPPPTLVEATMVPDGAISREWQFSDEEEKRRGEFRKLIWVAQGSKMDSDRKPSTYDGGSGSRSEPTLWWADEAMARRVARHLQPERAAASNERPTDTPSKESRKLSRWVIFRKGDTSPQSKPPQGQPVPSSSSSSGSTTQQSGDGVTMSVRAEEVTFRKENDLGIWETSTGWGIVIRVRIRHA